VEIVNKYVSDNNNDNNITLDNFFGNKIIDFIKIDVDGAEDKLLNGGRKFLSDSFMKIALCTYHRHNDEKEFNKILIDSRFSVEFSKRYMVFPWDWPNTKQLVYPYLRRGLIRGVKK
jgi:hypothetical protein